MARQRERWKGERVAACGSKERFFSFERARKVAKRMWRAHRTLVHPYHCRFCRCWHLGAGGA